MERLAVRLACRADDELRGHPEADASRRRGSPTVPGAQLPDEFVSREQWTGQRLQLLLRREQRQRLRRRGLEIDRYSIRQRDGALDLCRLGARKELEMDVSSVCVAVAYQLRGRDHLIHGARRADDAGAQEQPVHDAGAIHQVKRSRQLIGFEGCSPEVATSAEGAIPAVVLAGASLQDFQDGFAATVGSSQMRDARGHVSDGLFVAVLGREQPAAHTVIVLGRLAQQIQLVPDIHACDSR
jgi:hypothetical protein